MEITGQDQRDGSASKKATISFNASKESIENEITKKGVSLIFGGTTDGFGAAQNELLKLLTWADECAGGLTPEEHADYLSVKSLVDDSQIYDYGGKFRVKRRRFCIMHNFERIIEHFLKTLLRNQGLNHDAEELQNAYRVHYYMDKHRQLFHAVTIISMGGDAEEWVNADPILKNLFKEIAQTRWISQERQAAKLIELVNVPASVHLIERVKQYMGEDTQSWREICKLAVCFNSETTLSHMILASIYLTNHCPSGKSGEGYIAWSRIAASLCSSHFRCAMTVAASFLTIHTRWAAWADSRSGLNGEAPFGSKAIELVVFERNVVEEISILTHNWRCGLRIASDFINYESNRAFKYNMAESNDHIFLYWDKTMKEAVSQMMDKTLKYFRDPGQGIGWSFVHVTDPYLGPHYASVLLDYLGVIRDVVILHDGSDAVVDAPWTISSEDYAYPGQTFKQYRDIIRLSFTADEEATTAVFNAYGLKHITIINEMILLENNGLKKILSGNRVWLSVSTGVLWPRVFLQ